MTYESDAEAYRRKLSEIIATPEFKLTGPMALHLILALTSIHSALDERELYVRRQSSRGSRGGSSYEPVSLRRQIGQLKEAIDGLTENLHDAANPSFDLDD